MQAKCPAEERSCPSAGPRMPFERPVSEGAVVSRSGRRGGRQVRQYQYLATPWLAGGADVRVLGSESAGLVPSVHIVILRCTKA